MSQKIINKRSSVITEDGKPKLPSSDAIDYGEIAINYADGVETLSIKNSANEIIEFKSKEYVDNLVDNNKEIYVLDATRTDYETLFNEVSEAWDSNKQIILNYDPENNNIQLFDTLLAKGLKDEYSMIFGAGQVTFPYMYGNGCFMIPYIYVTIHKDNITLNDIPISEFTIEDFGYISWSVREKINLDGNGDGALFLSNDGTYKTINVDTSAIEQRIDGVETTIEENELVTSTALNELNARMTDVETNKASSTHDHDDRYLKEHQDISHLATQDELNSKQDTLVSGTNIKTINGQSILGSGNIEIETSGSTVDLSNYSTTEQVQAMIDASIITALNTEV